MIASKNVLIEYNLQFFGDASGSDKTEQATAKKLEDTRKKGQVAKSQELSNAIELITLFVILKFAVSFMGKHFIDVFRWAYGNEIVDVIKTNRDGMTTNTASQIFMYSCLQMLILVAPFFAGGFVVAFLSNSLQFKFRISFDPLKPSFDKFNPINGFKRIFSKKALFDLFLAIAKITLIFAVAYSALKDHINDLYVLYDLTLYRGLALVGNLVIDTGLRISLIYLIVGFADFFFQKWKFKEDVKMTKQEVKDEYKDSEGDPQIKGRQKQKMREASQRRMMQSVPEADVVITNPTHLAIAIKYDAVVANAPIVLAKGEDYLATKIKDVAKENHIDIVENKPLARAIYTTVDVGGQIPPELYQAVAEILAVIYNNRRH